MKDTLVLMSRTAEQQTTSCPNPEGRAVLNALARSIAFPESAPQVDAQGYAAYQQVLLRRYRAIYRYFPERNEARVYCIIHTRRRLPPVKVLSYIEF